MGRKGGHGYGDEWLLVLRVGCCGRVLIDGCTVDGFDPISFDNYEGFSHFACMTKGCGFRRVQKAILEGASRTLVCERAFYVCINF